MHKRIPNREFFILFSLSIKYSFSYYLNRYIEPFYSIYFTFSWWGDCVPQWPG